MRRRSCTIRRESRDICTVERSASRITGTADGGRAPFARVAELHFPSLEKLQAAAATEGAKRAVAHAISISSGGPPQFLIAEETSTTF